MTGKAIKRWISVGKPTINPGSGAIEYHFADGEAQEMHEGILDGRWFVRTLSLAQGADGDDVLIVEAVPQERRS